MNLGIILTIDKNKHNIKKAKQGSFHSYDN